MDVHRGVQAQVRDRPYPRRRSLNVHPRVHGITMSCVGVYWHACSRAFGREANLSEKQYVSLRVGCKRRDLLQYLLMLGIAGVCVIRRRFWASPLLVLSREGC